MAIDALLAAAVAAVWLACLAFPRLRTPLDRLHCASFVAASAGPALFIAAALNDGLTSRTWKVAAILVIALANGAATSHAIGRAIHLRGGHDA